MAYLSLFIIVLFWRTYHYSSLFCYGLLSLTNNKSEVEGLILCSNMFHNCYLFIHIECQWSLSWCHNRGFAKNRRNRKKSTPSDREIRRKPATNALTKFLAPVIVGSIRFERVTVLTIGLARKGAVCYLWFHISVYSTLCIYATLPFFHLTPSRNRHHENAVGWLNFKNKIL